MSNIWKHVFNWGNLKRLATPALVGAIIGALVTFLLGFYFVYSPQLGMYKKQLDLYQNQLDIMNESLSVQQEQIEIMNESLIKRVQLELEVVPRYDWETSGYGNGSVQLLNTTLTLPRNEQTTFHVYVSNVGNAIAHLLYWTVTIFSPPNTLISLGPMYDIQNIVLAPYSLYNMTYTFDPSTISPYVNELVFTFALMSTESIVYETVNATFR